MNFRGIDDIESADRWVEEWSAGVDEQSSQAAELAREVAGLTTQGYTADGAVEVTVDSRGAVVGIELDDRVLRWTAHEIAVEIMQAIKRGNELMIGRVASLVRDTVGPDSESGRVVVQAFEQRARVEPAQSGWQQTGGYDGRF